MTRYQIANTASGTILGTFDAITETEALNALAREAGYRDYAHAQDVAPAPEGEITVTALRTDAQQLCDEFRQITAPGSMTNAWKWAARATASLEPLGKSTIGSKQGTRSIQLFRCADGSRFAYDMDGAKQVWAIPA